MLFDFHAHSKKDEKFTQKKDFIECRGFVDLLIGSGLELIESMPNSEVYIIDINNRKLYSREFVEYRN